MFTDHMFFSWATEMAVVLAALSAFALSHRVRFVSKTKPVAKASPAKNIPFTLRNGSARSSTHFSTQFRGAPVARINRELFPLGRRAPAKGKEDTSC